ncbi:MAG: hypothetical protein AAFY26_02120 [Cyanobacteria bacterium J06638_22]
MTTSEKPAVRRNDRTSNGWDGGDIDELVLLFRSAVVWDGNHPSKSSRDYLVANGYAFRVEGYTALTGKGKIAALFAWPMPRVWFNIWRRGAIRPIFTKVNPEEAAR